MDTRKKIQTCSESESSTVWEESESNAATKSTSSANRHKAEEQALRGKKGNTSQSQRRRHQTQDAVAQWSSRHRGYTKLMYMKAKMKVSCLTYWTLHQQKMKSQRPKGRKKRQRHTWIKKQRQVQHRTVRQESPTQTLIGH